MTKTAKKTATKKLAKPKAEKMVVFDYHECAAFVGQKLGYDLCDTLGRFTGNPKAEYRDFWHFLIDHCDIHNGCQIWMPTPEKCNKDWQNVILQAFLDEFGEGPYWVSW